LCKQVALKPAKDASAVLEDLVKELNLKGAQFSGVLNPKDHRLGLVLAPNASPTNCALPCAEKLKVCRV
jgi:hypothetical protein